MYNEVKYSNGCDCKYYLALKKFMENIYCQKAMHGFGIFLLRLVLHQLFEVTLYSASPLYFSRLISHVSFLIVSSHLR